MALVAQAEFGQFRKGKRKPSTPMRGKGDSSPPPLDENEKPVGVVPPSCHICSTHASSRYGSLTPLPPCEWGVARPHFEKR
jgi:hypothetical protein